MTLKSCQQQEEQDINSEKIQYKRKYILLLKKFLQKVDFIIKHSGFYFDNVYFTEKKGKNASPNQSNANSKTSPRVHSLKSVILAKNLEPGECRVLFQYIVFQTLCRELTDWHLQFFPVNKKDSGLICSEHIQNFITKEGQNMKSIFKSRGVNTQ